MSENRKSNDEKARSTDRPPAPEDELERDFAAAIRAAKTSSPGRYGPPAATAKIRPFELAEALAKLSADGDPVSGSVSGDKPLRDDDAPFASPELEIVSEDEVPSGAPASKPRSAQDPPDDAKIIPARKSYTGLVLLALIVGVGVMAYVYVYANR